MGIELKKPPTVEEIEEICIAAEEAARQSVLNKVSVKNVGDLDVTVEAEGEKPLNLNVEVAVDLASGNQDLEPIIAEATEAAFSAAEAKVKELHLCVDTND